MVIVWILLGAFVYWLIGVLSGRLGYYIMKGEPHSERLGFGIVCAVAWPIVMPIVLSVIIITWRMK